MAIAPFQFKSQESSLLKHTPCIKPNIPFHFHKSNFLSFSWKPKQPTMASNFIVSPEEFNIFHNIDRLLYTRLVVNLEHDTVESLQVMGLLIWLERSGHISNLVGKMLSWPDSLINSIAEEAVLCFNCIQSEHFLPFQHIPLLQSISKTGLSLQFFHENRVSIMGSVSKIVSQVCSKAFQDIMSQVGRLREIKTLVPFSLYGQGVSGSHVGYYGGGQFGSFVHGYDIAAQKEMLIGEMSEVLSRIEISRRGDEDKSVPMDDRTIFLTFSKGYPILEHEVRDFFSRKYGECIEAIYMQEVVGEEDQALYARLVVRTPAVMERILNGNSKVKFSINGKHLWARKYVRKTPKSPPHSSPPSRPTSPIL